MNFGFKTDTLDTLYFDIEHGSTRLGSKGRWPPAPCVELRVWIPQMQTEESNSPMHFTVYGWQPLHEAQYLLDKDQHRDVFGT